jgi:16S rRNA U516 pseudouridylate synthase RsuA-like enzyme
MDIKLGNLANGKWRYLSDAELQQLMQQIEHSSGEAP